MPSPFEGWTTVTINQESQSDLPKDCWRPEDFPGHGGLVKALKRAPMQWMPEAEVALSTSAASPAGRRPQHRRDPAMAATARGADPWRNWQVGITALAATTTRGSMPADAHLAPAPLTDTLAQRRSAPALLADGLAVRVPGAPSRRSRRGSYSSRRA